MNPYKKIITALEKTLKEIKQQEEEYLAGRGQSEMSGKKQEKKRKR